MTVNPKPSHIYFRLLSYLRPHTLLLCVSIFLTLLYALSNVFVIPLVRDITHQVAKKNMLYFSNHVANAVLLYTVRLISKYGQVYVMTYISNQVVINLRLDLYKKLQLFSMDFYSKWKSGDILSRAFSDVELVKTAILLNFESVLPNILTLLGVTIYLFFINWKLACISLIGIPFFIFIVQYFTRRLKHASKQIQRKMADIAHILQESIQNIRIIQAFNMQKAETKKFHRHHILNFKATMKETRFRTTQEPLIALLQFIIFAAIIWYGGSLVVRDLMTGPVLLSFFTGIILLVDPILILSKVYSKTQQSFISANRVFELIDTPVTIVDPVNPISLSSIKGYIDFTHVFFSYNPSSVVLNDINLSVSAGETIAIIGLSGAGKSTFVNLIPRFHDPTHGTILLDNTPIQALSLEELRSYISIVPQEVTLFRGTLLENIRYGSPNASDQDIQIALDQANASEFIDKLPDGTLTYVGDQGQTLSGGQRQRISIARALLKNPKLLIMDEATSSLDTESESLIQNALANVMLNRTTFIIAHRLSTIHIADKIIVFHNGTIIESGTHAELIAQQGHYLKLYNLQFKNTDNINMALTQKTN